MSEEQYMRRAIALAKQGEGWVHPNPLVGAVIVKDGHIIAEGYHQRCGEAHAERNALAALTESAAGATLYVTLEPCCHQGRTPPCTEAIIEHRIGRVVIGSGDPNPKVAGRGADILRDAGICVEENFLKSECDALNPVFFHYITTKTPYVILKYAMTMDGKIATKTGASKWITGETARNAVQQMRHACMGIMVGIGTVLADDPMLNCRLEGGRDPVRIICDSHLRIPLNSQIVRTARQYETILVCALPELPIGQVTESGDLPKKALALLEAGNTVLNVPSQMSGVDLNLLMQILGEREIDSILLEGGGTLNESALRAGIVQEVCVFVAPKVFGGTAASPVMGKGVALPEEARQFRLKCSEQLGDDLLLTYLPVNREEP